MAQFISRIITHFVTEHLVGALARNKGFQRMALKIDSFLQTNKDVAKQSGEEYLKKGGAMFKEEATKAHATATEKTGFDFMKFVTAFKEEVTRDLSKITTKKK
jgi:hypothetical protein